MNRFLTVAVVAALSTVSAAHANHIDFLDEGAFSLTANGNTVTTTVTGIPPASTLGGRRDLTLGVSAGGTAMAMLTPVDPGTSNDVDAMTYMTNAAGFFFLVNGQGANLNANFLDIPNSTSDWDRVRINFGAGSAAASVTVELFSAEDGGNLTSTLAFAGGDSNLDFLYSGFGAAATPAFLRNIDRAAFSVNAPGAGSYVIESFNRNGNVAQAVPEPGSLALLTLGLAGVVALRRRA